MDVMPFIAREQMTDTYPTNLSKLKMLRKPTHTQLLLLSGRCAVSDSSMTPWG